MAKEALAAVARKPIGRKMGHLVCAPSCSLGSFTSCSTCPATLSSKGFVTAIAGVGDDAIEHVPEEHAMAGTMFVSLYPS